MPEINESEIPFEIPNNWKWVYLGELFQHNTGKALNAKDFQGKVLEYITTSNLYWDRFELKELKKMPFTDSEIEKCTVKKGDLLVCEGGDIGRSAIWSFDTEMRIQNHIHRLRKYSEAIETRFYYYILMFYKQTRRIDGIGIGLQGFSSNRVHTLVVPLPPLAEQKRIVEKVEQAFSVLDIIDELQKKYADNMTVLKSRLIDLAIRGKLTEQLSEDGTGASLIKENANRIKDCSIEIQKRVGKGCKPIQKIDYLFEIPETWCWERFGNLVVNYDNQRKPVTKSDRKSILGLYDYYGATGAIDRVDEYIFDGDYLMIGEDGGNFFVNRDNSFIAHGKFWANNHVHVVQPIICEIGYLKLCLDNYDLPKMGLIYGIGAPKLNQENMNSIPIPVPPLAEQKRIVERLDKLLTVCGEK